MAAPLPRDAHGRSRRCQTLREAYPRRCSSPTAAAACSTQIVRTSTGCSSRASSPGYDDRTAPPPHAGCGARRLRRLAGRLPRAGPAARRSCWTTPTPAAASTASRRASARYGFPSLSARAPSPTFATRRPVARPEPTSRSCSKARSPTCSAASRRGWTACPDLPDVPFGIVHLDAGRARPRSAGGPANVGWLRTSRWASDLAARSTPRRWRAPPGAPRSRALDRLRERDRPRLRRAPRCAPLVTEHGLLARDRAGATELETGLRVLGHDLSGGNPCASRARLGRRFRRCAPRPTPPPTWSRPSDEANRAVASRHWIRPGALVVSPTASACRRGRAAGPDEVARLDLSARLAGRVPRRASSGA